MPEIPETRNSFHILLYHGVHGDDVVLEGRNSSGKHISATRFRNQMKWLAANKQVVSMAAIAKAYRDHEDLPEGAVVGKTLRRPVKTRELIERASLG